MTTQRYVLDTSCLIYYFNDVFGQERRISQRAVRIVDEAFSPSGNVRLSIPSIVFLEIYEKWFESDELAARFRSEVFTRVVEAPHIEIRAIDAELLENLLLIDGVMARHEVHDKIVVALAEVLECPVITTDLTITEYMRAAGCAGRALG